MEAPAGCGWSLNVSNPHACRRCHATPLLERSPHSSSPLDPWARRMNAVCGASTGGQVLKLLVLEAEGTVLVSGDQLPGV